MATRFLLFMASGTNGLGGWDENGCGAWIRTKDLRVMSPTSCRCSTPRGKVYRRVCSGPWRTEMRSERLHVLLIPGVLRRDLAVLPAEVRHLLAQAVTEVSLLRKSDAGPHQDDPGCEEQHHLAQPKRAGAHTSRDCQCSAVSHAATFSKTSGRGADYIKWSAGFFPRFFPAAQLLRLIDVGEGLALAAQRRLGRGEALAKPLTRDSKSVLRVQLQASRQ